MIQISKMQYPTHCCDVTWCVNDHQTIKAVNHIMNTPNQHPIIERSNSREIPRRWSVMEWTHKKVLLLRIQYVPSKRKCPTLILVLNLCMWPGQIPSGNAIWPTCSNKYPENLAKLNVPADVSERQRVFVWRSARHEPHTPDKQLKGCTWHWILPVLCYIPFVVSRGGNVCRIACCKEFFMLSKFPV